MVDGDRRGMLVEEVLLLEGGERGWAASSQSDEAANVTSGSGMKMNEHPVGRGPPSEGRPRRGERGCRAADRERGRVVPGRGGGRPRLTRLCVACWSCVRLPGGRPSISVNKMSRLMVSHRLRRLQWHGQRLSVGLRPSSAAIN